MIISMGANVCPILLGFIPQKPTRPWCHIAKGDLANSINMSPTNIVIPIASTRVRWFLFNAFAAAGSDCLHIYDIRISVCLCRIME